MPAIQDYVNRHADRFVAELQEYCRTPAIASIGLGLEESATGLVQKIERLKGKVSLFRTQGSAPIVLGSIGNGPRKLLFYNHYDVQPAEPLEAWSGDPFRPWIKEGLIYGRGVADNRGNILARLQAVESYQEAVGPLPLKLIFCIEGEEEIGSPHLAEFVAAHQEELQADGCLWEGGWKDASGRPILYSGVKGLVHLELRVTGPRHDLHAMWSSVIPNPAWRLAHALSTLADVDGYIRVDGLAEQIQAPTDTEEKYLNQIPFDEEQIKLDFGFSRYIHDLTEIDLVHAYIFGVSCGITTLRAGYIGPGSKTVLPAEAVARIALYLVPQLDPELVLTLVKAHLVRHGFADIEVKVIHQLRWAKSDPESDLAQSALRAAANIYPETPVLYPMIPGGGPMYPICQELGIPVVSFGVENHRSNVHGPDENIRVEDYLQGIRFICELIRQFSTS